jgi:hypothetical protein
MPYKVKLQKPTSESMPGLSIGCSTIVATDIDFKNRLVHYAPPGAKKLIIPFENVVSIVLEGEIHGTK